MEFVEYGDMDMMMQYLKDVQAVQKKCAELSETIEFINVVRIASTDIKNSYLIITVFCFEFHISYSARNIN